MPNVSKINGFRPVKHVSGSPWMGNANIYYVSSASANMGVGDLVVTAGSATAAGTPTVQLVSAGSTAAVGVIVGIINAKLDPVSGAMTSGSISLDTPQYIASGGSAYVLVCDDPTVVFEAETSNGTPAAADVGLNASHANGTFNTTTGTSNATVDMGTKATTAALTLKILGFVNRPDNEIGASAKVHVMINNHQFKGSTGTAGV
jgi:hypothetical protein